MTILPERRTSDFAVRIVTLKQGAVARDGERRTTVGTAREGGGAARFPAAAFQHADQRKFGRGLAKRRAYPLGEAVEQCDSQRAPLDDSLLLRIEHPRSDRGIARLDDPEIEKQ